MNDIVTRNNYISKLKRHNEKALEFVVQEYGGQVKAAVYKNLSGMPEEIEECMDDVFLDVWNNIDRFDESKGSFRSWITAIARFRSIDYLRRYSRRCSEEDIADYENKLANDNLLEILNEEISDSMEKLLSGLSDEDRDIILRYYWDDQCVDKIAGLSNIYFTNKMTHVSSLPGLEHTSNKQTLFNVGMIDDAISEKKQISFVYNNYGEDKKLHPRREEPYVVNPYQMVANDGKYYLICNYDKYDNLSNYRVDKMTQVQIVDRPVKNRAEVKGMEHGLNLPKHMAEHIYMFADEPVTIVMRVRKAAISDVVDWFGRNFDVVDENIARQYEGFRETEDDVTYVRLVCSRQAMAHWAMQYGTSVEVIYPTELRAQIGEAVKEMNNKYNN